LEGSFVRGGALPNSALIYETGGSVANEDEKSDVCLVACRWW